MRMLNMTRSGGQYSHATAGIEVDEIFRALRNTTRWSRAGRIGLTALALAGSHAANAASDAAAAGQAGIDQSVQRAYSGVAAVTALTMIPEVGPGRILAAGTGSALYQGHAGAALGMSLRLSDNVKARLGVGIGGQSRSYGGGMAYQW